MSQKYVRYVHTLFELNWRSRYCINRGNLLHIVGTKELKAPASYFHSNQRYSHQRLLFKVPCFLRQNIRFSLGLKLAISSQVWVHQAASVKTKLRIYIGILPIEIRHSLNKVNG